MKKTSLFLSILLISFGSYGQGSSSQFNLGFEKKHPTNQLPDDWFQWGSGYKIRPDTTTRFSGRTAVLITPAGEKQANSFGCIAYAIPSKYEAKEIEVQAYMKLNNVTDGTIGLLLRIDGASGMLGFENMQSKNIQGTVDWALYSVKIPFPPEAKTIYIGGLLSGNGQLWVDQFKVLLDGKDISEAKIIPPVVYRADKDKEFDLGSGISNITLTKSKTGDLEVLGKIWGFLKYYHPSIAAGEYNWDYELFRVLPKVLKAKNPKERNSVLNGWVRSVGEFETAEKSETSTIIKLSPDLSWIDQETLGVELTNSLNKVKSAKRKGENYYVGKMPYVGNPEFKNEKPYSFMGYPDQGFRLLSLYRYWNMMSYFFPYKDLITDDWNKVLGEFIPKFVNVGNELEFKLSTLELIARISDTHANIWGSDYALNEYHGQRHAPLEITFIENKAVVTDYLDKSLGEKTGLKIGDVVETIDNKSVDEIIKEKLKLTPASNYPTQLRDIASNLLRTNKTTLNITYNNGAGKQNVRLETYLSGSLTLNPRYSRRDTCFRMIDPDVAYLYPGSIKNEYLPSIMREVNKTKGLVIDFRCYPSEFIVFTLGEYLFPEPTDFVKFSNCSIESPGLFTMTDPLKVGKSNPNYYKGKIVIIINELTQSSAEYHTMAFRAAPQAKVIGSTTAGADGNVSKIVLPGDIDTMISGIGVYYPDGRETQRIGIVPDLEVKPTIKGIREGKDEVLERAVKIINEK